MSFQQLAQGEFLFLQLLQQGVVLTGVLCLQGHLGHQLLRTVMKLPLFFSQGEEYPKYPGWTSTGSWEFQTFWCCSRSHDAK